MGVENFTFLSKDGQTQIHGTRWVPADGKIRGILQITHGMVEYIGRYDGFARYLSGHGYLVTGHDHLGHGKSVTDPSRWGYFGDHGSDILVGDMQAHYGLTRKKYPDAPYFMLGHSMGSFLLRRYLFTYGRQLAGAIIMGTGSQPDAAVKSGKLLCSLMARFKGWHYRSNLIQNMAFSGNDKKFARENLKSSWLTRDTEVVKAYNDTPECSFQFTLNGFYTLFDTIWNINRPEHLEKMPRKLPMFFVSGAEDPVGNFGAGVKKAVGVYQALGMEDITCKLYDKDRHEILNELDKEQVYEDIFRWLEEHLA